MEPPCYGRLSPFVSCGGDLLAFMHLYRVKRSHRGSSVTRAVKLSFMTLGTCPLVEAWRVASRLSSVSLFCPCASAEAEVSQGVLPGKGSGD